ncbi:MAG: response regulator [Anaerolineae bacterium]
MKALIIEDEMALQSLYGRILESLNYEVAYAENGDSAIKTLAQDHGFDLIMLDIRMPIRNGYDVLAYLADYPDIDKIHVIIATASEIDPKYMAMLPSCEFMLKPIMPHDLQIAITDINHLPLL